MEEPKMTEKCAVIKKIGDECIYIENTIMQAPNAITIIQFLLWILLCSGISGGLIMNAFHQELPETWIAGLMIGGLLATVAILVNIMMLGIGIEDTPSHKVYLANTNNEIYIPKTDDPERDQVAICKAAQELESIAIQRNREKNELERIASKCK